jgi:glucan biosynthesis protein C
MQQQPEVHKRLHALDGLRAAMMLLGIVLHSVVSYTVVDLGAAWPYGDQSTSASADVLVGFVHIFRMPIFFVLAGFFSAMLYLRRGSAGLVRNRATRIAVPFAIGWAILHPLVIGGFTFANVAQAGSISEGLIAFQAGISDGALLFINSTLHLWFLYYLIYFYVAAVVLTPVVIRLPTTWSESSLRAFSFIVSRPFLRLVFLSVITMAVLLPMDGILRTSTSFVPDLEVLSAYGLFFGFGWVLYLQRDLLAGFDRFAWLQTAAAVIIFLIVDSMTPPVSSAEGTSIISIGMTRSAMGALVVWLLFFGFTGLFLRYLNRPSAAVRYVVDSSYWIYLVHLPFTI